MGPRELERTASREAGEHRGIRAVDPRALVGSAHAGVFGRYLLPAIVLQSVLIGGGYATGREIVAYGARFGARGWVAAVFIFLGFSIFSVLTFEVSRTRGVYDYKRFIEQLIGRAWPAFDLLFVAMAVLVIAVMASAAANIMEETLHVPAPLGTALVAAGVGILMFYGAGLIELFKTFGTGLLYVAYITFAALVLTQWGGRVVEVFTAGEPAVPAAASYGAVALAGILYVGYNLVVFPTVLFVLHRHRSLRDSLIAGVLSGAMMTAPFVLTYLCILAFYPSPEVMDAPVPWLPILRASGGAALVVAFGVVMGWTLLETSVGLIHAILDRIDRNLGGIKTRLGSAVDAPADSVEGRLRPTQRGLLGMAILVAAGLLSRVGIIDLVARGYTLMGYLFIALFAAPLLIWGVQHTWRARADEAHQN